MMLTFATT